MLDRADLKQTVSKEEFKQRVKPLREALTALDGPMKAAGLPVVILFEGWDAAGKGSAIQRLILNFDPRWFTVVNTQPPTELERRRPTMWRHWLTLPQAGQMSILDGSWYQDVSVLRIEEEIDEMTNLRRMNEINAFERNLTDNGYLIVKCFLHITHKEQKERLAKLDAGRDTEWRVTPDDWRRCRQYDKYYAAYDRMLDYTNTPYAPWHVVSGMSEEVRTLGTFEAVLGDVRAALEKRGGAKKPAAQPAPIDPGDYRFLTMPKLADIDLSKELSEEKYKKELKKEQERLSVLHNRIYRAKVPVVIV